MTGKGNGPDVQLRRVILVLSCVVPPELPAQWPGAAYAPIVTPRSFDISAASPGERTLTALSLVYGHGGQTAIAPMSPERIDDLFRALHATPFSAVARLDSAPRWPQPWARVWYNTAEANPALDGAVWQGRGATVAAGAAFRWQSPWLAVSVGPAIFATQNADYVPLGGRPTGGDAFGDPINAPGIDHPYRFGSGGYARIVPGESWLRLHLHGLAVGFSTASQKWGPAHHYPLLIGAEGGGYPRAFAELRDVNVGLGRLTAHWSAGRLEASDVAGLEPGARSRFAPALAVAFTPGFLSALELGGGRFFHLRWPSGGPSWTAASLPFNGLLKRGDPTGELDLGPQNQLASVYFRLQPAGDGVEIYGEFLREDHNADLRDLALEPDHQSAFTLGWRKVLARQDTSFTVLGMEGSNGRITHLSRVRPQSAMYRHVQIAEGHTHMGQLLGTTAVLGGGGLKVELARVGVRRSVYGAFETRRAGQNEEGGTWNGTAQSIFALSGGAERVTDRGVMSAGLSLRAPLPMRRAMNVTVEVGWR